MSELILILAPRGRDAEVIEQVMARAGIAARICPGLQPLHAQLDAEIGGIIVSEEALAAPDLEPLLAWCDAQPPWSDLPVIVLAISQAGRRNAMNAAILERLGNVVLIERPANAETLASAARSSLRARRRQYEARALLLERERGAADLRHLNETLERRVEERARALDRAHEALTFALDSAGMASWELDLLTDLSTQSPQRDRIFGYAEPVAGWGRDAFLAHVVEEDRTLTIDAFAHAIATGVLDAQCRIRRADGIVRWIVIKGEVGYDEDRRPVRMTGIVMDTTDRRATEDALHQAQKMEAIGQLTGGVAHDFNNLLTIIVGGLELISRKPAQTDRVLRLADAALTAAKRGEQLTRQLLSFSRRQSLAPQTLHPNRVLREFESLARRAVGEAVVLRLDLGRSVWPIRIDPAQFESAILNLVVNARDAMPSGGEIVIASRNLPGAHIPARGPRGDTVAVSVSDNGSGIDDQTLARAYEPFFTTKEVGKGSGLGLSQVYGFARGAGGDVGIETALGSGTTVTLYLPRSDEPITDEDPVLDPPVPASRGETILLVEDDEEVRAMAIESLEELRYQVVVASDAGEALAHVRGDGRIDLMFSDVVMPGGMNGAQLAIQARSTRPGLKILLTSGYAGTPDAVADLDDAFELLDKPYGRHELARRIRTMLGAD